MTEIIYEDDELQAFWLQGDSPYVVVSFGDLISLANGRTFSIEAPASKSSISCLGIMAKRPNWYPRANLISLWQSVLPRVNGYRERILYGASMGAHGAVKSCSLFGATTTIALCPQWSINPVDGDGLGWDEYFRADAMRDMKIEAGDLSGDVYVFSDPDNKVDEFHRQQIAKLNEAVHSIAVWHCDHNVTPVLSGTRNFRSLVSLCRSSSIEKLSCFVNRTRRPHFFRKKALIEHGLLKRPSLTIDVLCRTMSSDPLVREIVAGLDKELRAAAFACNSERGHALFFGNLINAAPTLDEKFRLSLLLPKSDESAFALHTVFGTRVLYDPMSDALCHTSSSSPPPDAIPVKVYLRDRKIEIYASNQFCRITLPRNGQGGTDDSGFEVEETSGGNFTLRRNNQFLSANPAGTITCDRSEAFTWEYFTVRFASGKNIITKDLKKPMPRPIETPTDITICAIAKDEGRYITEWIAYHLAVGATKIIIFSNDSSDGMENIVTEIARRDSRVELIQWPSKDGVSPQVSAYNHALKIVRTHWIGFIDIDEFLVPLEKEDLRTYLATVPADVSSVHVNWRGFGSGGQTTDTYKLVTDTFTKASHRLWGNNHHFKSIARTALATEAFIHDIETYQGRRVLSDMQEFETTHRGLSNRIVHAGIQINHYQSKTFPEFEARMRRGDANFPKNHPGRSRDATLERFRQLDQNSEDDQSILKFSDSLKKELEKLNFTRLSAL